MYYPYLRGRQFELLALRNFTETLTGHSKIFPIIEPVRENKNSLKKAICTMTEKGMKYGIILNPEYGDCAGEFLDFSNETDFPEASKWSPSFILNKNNISLIEESINKNEYKDVILILPKGSSIDEDHLINLISNKAISKVLTDKDRRRITRATRKYNKELIELDDKFIAQPTNQSYINIDEDLFSEEFAYFKDEGYAGFADYTILPNEFREGGTLPKVVVIHLSYKKTDDQIFVKHFCSNSNQEDRSNIQGKFAEAAHKAILFFSQINYNSPAIDYLKGNIVSGTFQGLGVLKKISILHHLDLLQRILNTSEQ